MAGSQGSQQQSIEPHTNHGNVNVVEHILEADPLADTLRSFIARQPEKSWKGAATSLLNALTSYTDDKRIRNLHPNTLSGNLRRISPFVRKLGIEVEFSVEGHRRRRIIRIRTNSDFTGLDSGGGLEKDRSQEWKMTIIEGFPRSMRSIIFTCHTEEKTSFLSSRGIRTASKTAIVTEMRILPT